MEYREKMLQIANKLTKYDVENIKFIYSDIGDAILEKVTTGLELITVLEMHDYVAPDNLDSFKSVLLELNKNNLVAIINGQGQASSSGLNSSSVLSPNVSQNNFCIVPDVPQGIRLNKELTPKLCDKVSFKIGKDWRRFGRHLGFEEAELEHIDSDNRRLHDKAIQVLYKWKQKTGHATWEQLKNLLVTFERKDIVREIEQDDCSNPYVNHAPTAQQSLNSSSVSSAALFQNNFSIAPAAPEISAKVLYPYIAIQPDELTLVIGEVIRKVIKKDDGWWEGEIDGKCGIFPNSFVEVISDTVLLPTQQSAQNNTNVGSTVKKALAHVPGLNSSSDTIASESQNSDLNQVSSREGEIMSEKELQDQISVDERGKDSDIQDTDITDYKQSLALNTKP